MGVEIDAKFTKTSVNQTIKSKQKSNEKNWK